MTKTLDQVRTYFTTRRDLRRRTERLSRELAAYDSPSDRLDLEAAIARYPESETREVETILRLRTIDRLGRDAR